MKTTTTPTPRVHDVYSRAGCYVVLARLITHIENLPDDDRLHALNRALFAAMGGEVPPLLDPWEVSP